MGILNALRRSKNKSKLDPNVVALSREIRDELLRRYDAGHLDGALYAARDLLDLQRRFLGESHADYLVGMANVESLEALLNRAISERPVFGAPVEPFAPPTTAAPLSPPPVILESPKIPLPAVPIQAASVDKASLAILDRVLGLAYQGTGDHTCLTDVQASARRLIAGKSISSDALIPFEALLKMIEEGQTLGNEEWIEVHTRIVKGFGRPLGRAVGSGKIVAGNV